MDFLLECPYDKSHKIREERWMLHLLKCRKSYIKRMTEQGLEVTVEICPYDYLHHLPADKMNKHKTVDCTTAMQIGLIPTPAGVNPFTSPLDYWFAKKE